MNGNYRFAAIAVSLLLALSVFQGSASASEQNPFHIGFEQQVYRTGIIPGIRFERGFAGRHSVHLRLGYQEIRHEDFGVHDDERGNGAGFSLGYSRFQKAGFARWSFGIRSDVWFNTLDWVDDEGTVNEVRGTTDVIVLQPTIDASYRYPLTKGFFVTPSVAAGFEINVDTDGEDVGEGFILLFGLTVGMQF